MLFISLLIIIFLLAIVLFQEGGEGRVIDMGPSSLEGTLRNFASITIESIQPSVEVPKEVKEQFEAYLSKNLYEEQKFKKGFELRIHYRFVSLKEGCRLERWLMRNTGKGSVLLEINYADQAGKTLGKIMGEGEVNSGLLGGSFNIALEKVAKEIARHTAYKFKK